MTCFTRYNNFLIRFIFSIYFSETVTWISQELLLEFLVKLITVKPSMNLIVNFQKPFPNHCLKYEKIDRNELCEKNAKYIFANI